jgi:hypothetical protein
MKKKINISLDTDIAEKLKRLAWAEHKTISGYITDIVFRAKEKDPQLPGQMNISDLPKPPKP